MKHNLSECTIVVLCFHLMRIAQEESVLLFNNLSQSALQCAAILHKKNQFYFWAICLRRVHYSALFETHLIQSPHAGMLSPLWGNRVSQLLFPHHHHCHHKHFRILNFTSLSLILSIAFGVIIIILMRMVERLKMTLLWVFQAAAHWSLLKERTQGYIFRWQ